MNEQNIILDRAINGDKKAFEELIRLYTPFLKSIGRCYFTSYFDIEDVMQEVWIKVFKYIDTIKDKKKFKSWLTSVMRYQCLSSKKSENKRINKNIPLDIEERHDLMAFLIDDSDLTISAENKELRKVIKSILARMPEQYSLPLVLHYVENMSLLEIKDALNIPVSTIKWRLYQGRILFKKYAGDHLCRKYIIIGR